MTRREIEWELARSESRAAHKQGRKIRWWLVEGDGDSRPSCLWRTVAKVLKVIKRNNENQEDPAKKIVEVALALAAWASWATVLGLGLADGISSHGDTQSVIYGNQSLGIVVLSVGSLFLVTVLTDIGSYKPRVFAQCAGPPEDFFTKLATLAPTLKNQVKAIEVPERKTDTWKAAKELEQGLLAECHQFLLLDDLRARITVRTLHRLAALIGSLALIGYGFSTIANGEVLAQVHATHGIGLPEQVYFALVTFFTVGFGDLYPVHSAVGYTYVTIIVSSFAAVVYFILTDIVASHGEFRFNIRAAAETFVLEHSSL